MRWLWRHHVRDDAAQLAALTALAAGLQVAAAVGLSYVAGFSVVENRLLAAEWPWLFAALGGVLLTYPAYYLSYRGTGRETEGETLDERTRLAVAAVGFGNFLARSGSEVDKLAAEAAGASERQAGVRVAFLDVVEHAVLALPGWGAALGLLALGPEKPHLDFLVPWAVGPVVGMALAFWLAGRFHGRWRERDDWRGSASIVVDAVYLLRRAAFRPHRHAQALGGMLAYWVLGMFSLWAGIRTFHFHMNFGSVVVAFGTAMIVTRRTGPLGGAGLLDLALPPTLWIAGAPLSAAVLGTFVYRFFSLWIPLPVAFGALPRVRALLERSDEKRRGKDREPALQP